jgi:hypothetical protein
MSLQSYSHRFWHVGGMSGSRVIPENAGAPVLRVEGIGLDAIQSAFAACK